MQTFSSSIPQIKIPCLDFQYEVEVVKWIEKDIEKEAGDPKAVIQKGYRTPFGTIVVYYNLEEPDLKKCLKKVHLLSVELFSAIDATPKFSKTDSSPGTVITPLNCDHCHMILFRRKFSYNFQGFFNEKTKERQGQFIEGKTKQCFQKLLNELEVKKKNQPKYHCFYEGDRQVDKHCAFLEDGTATPILFKEWVRITL